MTDCCLHHLPGNVLCCAAGVDLATVRDADLRIPCVIIKQQSGSIPCPLRTLPPEPPAPEVGRASALLALALDNRCLTCGAVVEKEVETGITNQLRAEPCMHIVRTRVPARRNAR